MANNGTLQYKKEFCEMLIKHMSQGNSFSTFSTISKVTRTTLYDWVKKYPEFARAKELGEDEAKRFLESRLMAKISGQDLKEKGINTKMIDTTALIFALKTRFYKEYGDRMKMDHMVSDKETQALLGYQLKDKKQDQDE